jgi:hypothetical protein
MNNNALLASVVLRTRALEVPERRNIRPVAQLQTTCWVAPNSPPHYYCRILTEEEIQAAIESYLRYKVRIA